MLGTGVANLKSTRVLTAGASVFFDNQNEEGR